MCLKDIKRLLAPVRLFLCPCYTILLVLSVACSVFRKPTQIYGGFKLCFYSALALACEQHTYFRSSLLPFSEGKKRTTGNTFAVPRLPWHQLNNEFIITAFCSRSTSVGQLQKYAARAKLFVCKSDLLFLYVL